MTTKKDLLLALLALFTLNSALPTASAQGTAFTYQGQLQNSGSPANGDFDFTFALFNNSTTNTGQQIGITQTNLDVGVTNGLFIVTLDFGGVFTGTNYWLAIGVRSNGGGSFTALNPLQELTPTPYAIYAPNAGTATNISGTIANSSLPSSPSFSGTVTGNSFSGNGSNLTSLNASNIASGTVADARLSTNVALLDKTQAFTGANTFNNNVAVSTGSGAEALQVSGSITGGYATPMSLIQNNSTAANASPALRVVGSGNTPNGVLSVSTAGTGLLAQFGNASSFVAELDTNGNWTASSFNGNGANLTSLNASDLSSGTVADARLSTNAALLNGTQTFTGANTFSNNATTFATTAGTASIVNDSGVVPGIVATGGLVSGHMRFRNGLEIWPDNIPSNSGYLDVRNTNTVATIALNGATGIVTASNVTAASFDGAFNGNGAGLTNLAIPATIITNTATNPVPVVAYNTPTNPVPVINVASDSPYVVAVTGSFSSGSQNSTIAQFAGNSLTVPAGKRLVVETFSCYSENDTTTGAVYSCGMALTCNGTLLYYFVNTPPTSANATTSFTQPVKLYADPSSTIGFSCDRSSNAPSPMIMVIQIQGYLINTN